MATASAPKANTAAPTKPVDANKPAATPPANAAAPPANAATPPEEKKARSEKSFHDTAEAAVAFAKGRVKGAKRAFKATLNGKTRYMVAYNADQAWGMMGPDCGGTIEELGAEGGGGARTPKAPASPDAFWAAISNLPAAEQEAAKAQLKKLMGIA